MPPVVPRYDNLKVQTEGIPNVSIPANAPESAFGGGKSRDLLNSSLIQGAKTVQDIASQEKQKADDAANIKNYSDTSLYKMDLLKNPENGALTKMGKNSFGITEEYNQKFDEYADRLEETMTPSQRQFYQKVRLQQKNDLTESLENHTFVETQKYNDEVSKTAIETTRDEALLNYKNPQKIYDSIAMQQSLINQNGKSKGLPNEAIKQDQDLATSKTHADVIARMLANGEDKAAKSWYDLNKDQITQGNAEIEKALESGAVKGRAQRNADIINSKYTDLKSAMNEAKKIDDPKEREETEQRIENYHTVLRAAQNESQDLLTNSISALAEQTRDINIVHRQIGWDSLPVATKNSIDKRIEDLNNGSVSETDRETYQKLYNMMETSKTSFINLNLNSPEYKYKLNQNDYKKFAEAQVDLKSGKTNKADGIISDTRVMDGILSQNGFNIKAKPNSDQGKVIGQFKESLDSLVVQFESEKGRKPNNDELRAMGNKLMVQYITQPGVYGFLKYGEEKQRLFQFGKAERQKLYQSGVDTKFKDVVVPEDHEQEIKRNLEKNHITPTKDLIIKYYLLGQGFSVGD